MKDKALKRDLIKLFIVVIIVFSGLWWHFYKISTDKEIILKDYEVTIAKIIGYSKIGTHNNIYVKYTYSVDGKKYFREVHTVYKFPECYKEITKPCSDMRFWAVYSIEHPEKSLIDLSRDIQFEENPKFSEVTAFFK